MIQVRNVPDGMHEELVRRAKLRGQTLSGYLKRLIEADIARPPREEVFARIHSREPVKLSKPAAEFIREEHEEWDSRFEK